MVPNKDFGVKINDRGVETRPNIYSRILVLLSATAINLIFLLLLSSGKSFPNKTADKKPPAKAIIVTLTAHQDTNLTKTLKLPWAHSDKHYSSDSPKVIEKGRDSPVITENLYSEPNLSHSKADQSDGSVFKPLVADVNIVNKALFTYDDTNERNAPKKDIIKTLALEQTQICLKIRETDCQVIEYYELLGYKISKEEALWHSKPTSDEKISNYNEKSEQEILKILKSEMPQYLQLSNQSDIR